MTEHEIDQGICKVVREDDRRRNCLVFIRKIMELDCYLDRSRAFRFFDLHGNTNQLNDRKHQALRQLCQEKVLPKISTTNVFRDSVYWSEPNGVDPKAHSEYLEKVCCFFYEKMRALIDKNIEKQSRLQRDDLFEEVLQHWYISRDLCDSFMGRQPLLNTISSYILSESRQPFVIYGESGHGKTSVIAKAASDVGDWVKASGRKIHTTVILRFCGTTPASSNIRQLLHSLCHQIAFATSSYRHAVPKDYKEMKVYLRRVLQSGEFRGLVVIFLDAINQLSADDNAHNLDWLPPKVSNNVKIIVSTMKNHPILDRLSSKIESAESFMEVEPLELSQCCMILNALLDKVGRMISYDQCKVIKEAFSVCASPLFTKLMFEEVVRWKSYTEVDRGSLPLCVKDCINQFFERLEVTNGKTVVVHALSYITASRTGLSKTELNDVMSLDDTVLNSIFTFWEPPLRCIPPNVLPRIYHVIKGYLVERETDEATVLFWYHQQFIEVAKERYLSDTRHTYYIHSIMADYFLGKWGGMKSKPFQYEPFIMKRLKRLDPNGSAVRYVPEQPLIFSTFNTSERYNYRKLNQLPYHLYHSRRFLDLNNEVYFNYQWLYTKLRACSVQQVIADLNMSDDRETVLLTDAFRMAEAALTEEPNVLGVELTGRLLPHYDKYPNIRNLIDQCDFESMQKCPIVPNWQAYTSPGGPLQYVCEANQSIKSEIDVDTIQCQDTVLLTAKPYHGNQMRIWDVTQGEPQQDMTLPSGTRVYPTPDGKFIHLFKNKKFLQTYRVDSGDLVGEVKFDHGNLAHIVVSNKYVAFTFEAAPSPVLIDTDAKVVLQRFQYKCQAVAISTDERYLVCNNGQSITVHELPLLERKCIVPTGGLTEKILFTSQPSKLYVMLQTHDLSRLTVNLTQKKGKLSGIATDIEMKDFVLSHKEDMLLMRASRCLFLFGTAKDKLLHRIQKMPKGVFVEHLSTFKEAGFTPSDNMVVAARHTYLGIWDTKTGEPLRLLQSSVTPIVRLFTSDYVNKVITLLSDYSIQVWNLDNLDAHVQHCNAVLRGRVMTMAASAKGYHVICAGAGVAEAVVVDVLSGKTEQILHHTDEVGIRIESVLISPSGRIAATRVQNSDVPDYLKPWPLLKEDKLWHMNTGKVIRGVSNNRYIIFSSDDSRVVLLPCRSYSTFDWSITSYDILVIDPSGQTEEYILALPEGDVVGQPILVGCGSFLVFILQKYNRDEVSSLGSIPSAASSKSSSVTSSLYLCVYSFEKVWKGVKYVAISSLWNNAQENDNFIDVRDIDDDNVLLIYGQGTTSFSYKVDGSLDRSRPIPKGAFVYSVRKGNVLHHMMKFMNPESDLSSTWLSSHGSILVDNKYNVFDASSGMLIHRMKLQDSAGQNSVRLLLDGKYLAVLSANRRMLYIHRTRDSTTKAKIFIHGTALHMETCHNDRTLVIGCTDGRTAMFTLVLDEGDHVKDVVQKLPSRTAHYEDPRQNPILDKDVNQVQISDGELKCMSVLTRKDIMAKRQRRSSFKAMGAAVMLTREYNKVQTSKACSIQ